MKLVIKNIKKSFKEKDVLIDASYQFENGKIYGLLGRNGAGKTTLFNILYRELEEDDGNIGFFDDEKLRELKVEDIGMVFAETHLPDFLTAYEYIKFIIDINNPNELFKIDTYFDEMSIEQEDRHRLLKDFSSGMKAKVALLAIYIQKPKIILLDEPLTAVDVVSAAEIKRFFRSLKNDHIVIVSTHMLDLAKDLCDEIVLLHNGKLQSLSNLEKDENYESKIVEALKEEKDV
ncbi:ABC transporter ATP-binding protein [Helcococcus ovis]|uniref:ABC transporter ATP-binding protein n=2 Tax=Helcococcus ovis TaxID=72026 RepID=A0A4R9C093_9FIRM|nr:ABC transporter ATP-binding protein [Helcococcus ovis]TFF65122.1 ABC transporter ATP-binding protein [Helcococcus ovis]TFF66365.1 ABC transporter ATP-binding protein [Helcococcus ovis]